METVFKHETGWDHQGTECRHCLRANPVFRDWGGEVESAKEIEDKQAAREENQPFGCPDCSAKKAFPGEVNAQLWEEAGAKSSNMRTNPSATFSTVYQFNGREDGQVDVVVGAWGNCPDGFYCLSEEEARLSAEMKMERRHRKFGEWGEGIK